MRGTYVFAFNFSPSTSVSDYSLPVKAGSYTLALSSDDTAYGGYDRIDHAVRYVSQKVKKEDVARVYLPARTAIVLRQSD